MLQIAPQQRLFIAVDPADFRCGIDALKSLCQPRWSSDPFSGHLFIFRNKSSTAVKLLAYDGNGFLLCHKRFSSGKLKWWPQTAEQATQLRAIDLMVMLQQGNPQEVHVPAHWRRLPSS